MTLKINDKTLGALCYAKPRDIRPAVLSLKRQGMLQNLEEVTVRTAHGPLYMFDQEEANIIVSRGPIARRDSASTVLLNFFGQALVAPQVVLAAPPAAEEPPAEEMPKYPLITIVQTAQISFQGLFNVEVSLGENKRRYVSPNALAAELGLDERAFNKRIDRRFARWVVTVATPLGARRLLDIYAIPGVLYTTAASLLAPEKRPLLEKMQEDLTPAIGQYVFEGNASNPDFSQEERDRAREAQDKGINEKLELLAKSMDALTQAIPGIMSLVAQQRPATDINTSTHAAAKRIDPDGKDSCRSMADHFGVPEDVIKSIQVKLGLIGDLKFGSWYDVVTGKHGDIGDNWASDIDATVAVIEAHITTYKEIRRKHQAGGIKDFAKKALTDTLSGLVPIGIGTHTKLRRSKLKRKGNYFHHPSMPLNQD